jgi:hypothetical protein
MVVACCSAATARDHALDGSAPDRVLVREPDRAVLPVAWLADGRIVYMSSPNLAEYDLRLLTPGGTSGQVVMPLGFGLDPDISPDGRWLAYNPWTGSGSAAMLRDVVVQAFPGPGARLQVCVLLPAFAGFASPPRLSTQQSHRRGVHEQGFAMFAGKLLL